VQKQYVRELFDSIAHRYDLLNHLLSVGIDRSWRRKAIDRLQELNPKRILDVATGTGDFALAAMRLQPTRVIGIDIAENMLELGRAKVHTKNLDDVILLEKGEAEQLPYPDNAFDAAIVAFGVRNFEDIERSFAEIRRVIRQDGTFLVLEFSRPRVFPFKQLYFLYFRHVLPRLGRMISKSDHAYAYLPDTVMKFPDGEDFLDLLRNAGFTATTCESLTMGIATIYTGKK
jgi:demethylmenaquinone methyltransferase/2-methoxy-6-polyprenyl-1,4-benzoquinol methylase